MMPTSDHNSLQKNEINPDDFLVFISVKTASLQTMCKHIITYRDQCVKMPRPYFGRIHLEATKIEELLDSYGARNNEQWHTFRKAVASMKLFSNVVYICLHIKHSINSYSLLEIEDDFAAATNKVLSTFYDVVIDIANTLLGCAEECGITTFSHTEKRGFNTEPPVGKLNNNRKRRVVANPEKNIVYLVSKFLNLSEEIKHLEIFKIVEPEEYADCVPAIVSEEKTRWIENKFHNLQSLYDTNISDSNLESVDEKLPILRGHASIIFHLLEVATELCHYYERHLLGLIAAEEKQFNPPISQQQLLEILFTYSLAFSENYLIAFHGLSQQILRQYADESSLELPIPNHRGFHIRPSTLVSRIVIHYGSKISMEFEKRRFDASKPLELFRINEKINSLKRRNITQKIAESEFLKALPDFNEKNYRHILQEVFLWLLEDNSIVMYESNFSFHDIKLEKGESLLELVKRTISRYLALGRIDITNDMRVIFHGDLRVLNDLKVLADNGYGEDNYGNNILLPKELSYLRR